MSPQSPSELKFDIGHVLFIDIVGYSKLLIGEQSNQIQTLREIVRGTEQFKKAEAEGKLLRLPTGDGGALVFRSSLEAPVLCSLEISKALKSHPELKVRMIEEIKKKAVGDFVPPFNLALVYLGLGDRSRAVDYLEQASAADSQWMMYLKIDRVFDPLRADPRFIALMKKCHFEK